MKYFSTETKKVYDTVEELEEAEKAAAAAKDERKEAAEKVETAYKAMKEAKQAYEIATQEYQQELSKFCDKYGAYKTTIRSGDLFTIDPFWKFFNF